MRIHHDKHHKSYVDGLNKAESALAEARRTNKFDLVKYWENELAFNGAGHYLHTIFWDVMSPQGGGRPTGSLLRQIEHDFGSYDAFRKHSRTQQRRLRVVAGRYSSGVRAAEDWRFCKQRNIRTCPNGMSSRCCRLMYGNMLII